MFPIQMTFTVSTVAELAALTAAIPIPAGTDKETLKVFKEQEAPKASPKPEKPAAQAEAAKSAPPADTPATPEPTAAASGELDYDKDVKPAFLKLVQTKGRAAGRKIIDAFAPTKEKLSEAITTQEQFAQAIKLIAKEMS